MTTLNLGRVVGQDGEDGRGIVSIEKTATVGLVDTYTITYTDGTTSTFDVTNGQDGTGGGQDYTDLTNKPSINDVTLEGNKSLSELGVQATLTSGTNIKTINGQSILGAGNIEIGGGDSLLTEENVSSGGDVAVTGLELDLYTYDLLVGGSFYINPIVLPTNATDRTVSWTSSDSTIATVSTNGQVDGIATGTANITCTTHDGGFTKTCVVTVTQGQIVPVDSVSLNKSAISLQAGGSETLVATVLPANASNKTVTWSTSDSSKATVNNGVVTAVTSGAATITATSNQDNTKYATCEVTIVAPPTPTQKIQFSTLEREAGAFKSDGTIAPSVRNTYHIEIPYTEGMQVYTMWKNGWDNSFSPINIRTGSTITRPTYEYRKDDQGNFIYTNSPGSVSLNNYVSAILTGYEAGSTVVINMFVGSDATTQQMDDTDSLYYVEGGNE